MDENTSNTATEPQPKSNSKLWLGGLLVLVLVLVGLGALSRDGEEAMEEDQAEEVAAETATTEEAVSELSGEEDSGGTAEGAVQEFTVHGGNFSFDVNEMRVNKGDTVRITFINDEGMHDWKIDEFTAATNIIKTGEQETIEFVADQTGEFEYYCSVGQHRQLGMKGTLVVE